MKKFLALVLLLILLCSTSFATEPAPSAKPNTPQLAEWVSTLDAMAALCSYRL